MVRIDDYVAARNLAVETLSTQAFDDVVKRTGFEAPAPEVFRVPFLDRTYRIGFPEYAFRDETDAEKEVPIQEQVLILHYMLGQDVSAPSGNWVAYREIQGASFYFSAFVKRAIDPLKKTFGRNAAGLVRASAQLGATPVEPGDAAFEFKLFPRVWMRLTLWQGDEEFAPEANILFDETIAKIFSPEDIAWLAGMLVYRLMALSS